MATGDSPSLAVIGGTGLNKLGGFDLLREVDMQTPYGEPSASLHVGRYNGKELVFLARHGDGHHIPPHVINYRANIWALQEFGIKQVLAVAAVGGIRQDMQPGRIAFPDQLIDYTWGRAHTFHDGGDSGLKHIEFGNPYNEALRAMCLEAARNADLEAVENGIYAATQGPRLETEAEIRRLQRDGADMVGMTGMPEASLAREAALEYACCAVVVNWAAGLADGGIHDQIEQSMEEGMQRVQKLLDGLTSCVRHGAQLCSSSDLHSTN